MYLLNTKALRANIPQKFCKLKEIRENNKL